MATYSPVVTCYEELASVSESYSLTASPEARVTLRCAFSDRYGLVADLLGNKRAWPHGTFTSPPTAQSASIRNVATTQSSVGQSIVYDHSLIDVVYNHETRDLVAESLEPTADFITLDHRFFRWGSAAGAPLAQGEAPGKLRRGLNLRRTLYNVSSPLSSQLLTSVGGVNDTTYSSTLLGLSFDPGTLLFTPPLLDIVIDTSGTDGFTVDMKFMFRPEGWNQYWRAASQAYEEIYLVNGGAYKSYPEVSMSDLLS